MVMPVQVSRGEFIVFFNDIFDALCKLSADSDPNVQSAAHLLDRLVKVRGRLCFLEISRQFPVLVSDQMVAFSVQFRDFLLLYGISLNNSGCSQRKCLILRVLLPCRILLPRVTNLGAVTTTQLKISLVHFPVRVVSRDFW